MALWQRIASKEYAMPLFTTSSARAATGALFFAAVLSPATPGLTATISGHNNGAISVQQDAGGDAQSVIQDQLEAFKSGDTARAYSHAAPNIRTIFPNVESFMQMVTRGYPMVNDPADYRFGRSIETGGALHQEVIITDRSGRLWQAIYMLQRQPDGSLKIIGVKIDPFKGVGV
jgi:hypothetical protein